MTGLWWTGRQSIQAQHAYIHDVIPADSPGFSEQDRRYYGILENSTLKVDRITGCHGSKQSEPCPSEQCTATIETTWGPGWPEMRIKQLHWADRPYIVSSLLALLLVPTTEAQAANPMDALQFYVGKWSCLERKANEPPLSSTFTFAVQSNLMRQWIVRPKQGSM